MDYLVEFPPSDKLELSEPSFVTSNSAPNPTDENPICLGDSAQFDVVSNAKEQLAGLEAHRRNAEQQRLLSEIEELRKAEVEQRAQIDEASATSRWRSAKESWTEAEVQPPARRGVDEEPVSPPFVQLEDAALASEVQAQEKQRVSAQIMNLGRAASQQIDRMDDAKSRLVLLEQIRAHAEKMVCERALREIRLQAEIDALRQAETEQIKRIEEAEIEFKRLTDEQSRAQTAAEIRHKDDMAARERATAEMLAQLELEARSQAQEQARVLEAAQARHQTEADARQREVAEALEQIEVETRLLAEEQARALEAAEARRIAEAEALKRVAAEAIEQAEDEARRRVEEDAQRLGHLEEIRTRAETAAQQRAEKERQLNEQLLAFGEAAAEQLKRIEKAEAELSESEARLQQFEAKANQTAEQLATRLAELESRSQAAENQRAEAEAQAHARAEEVEQRLGEINEICAEAELEAERRTQLEWQLTADLESLRQAQERQLKRIEKAQADTECLSEKCVQLRQLAEEEEQRLANLKSVLSQTEGESEQRRQEEQHLILEIEALKKLEADQVTRIAAAELALVRQEELNSAEPEVIQQHSSVDPDLVTEAGDESKPFPSERPSEDFEAETATAWPIADHSQQPNTSATQEFEWGSDETSRSPAEVVENYGPRESVEEPDESTDSVGADQDMQLADEALTITSPISDEANGDKASPQLSDVDLNRAFSSITVLFDDGSEGVRNAAARALYDLNPGRAETFTRALREAPQERRLQIIKALDGSGLAAEAIESLAGESREKTYDAFSLLFLMAKAGEVHSLLQAIEKHPNTAIRLSVIKLLTFCGRSDVIPALRSLAVRGALPIEVRSALMESIYEISGNARERSRSAA